MNFSDVALFDRRRSGWKASIEMRKYGNKIVLMRWCCFPEMWMPNQTDPEQYLFNDKGVNALEVGMAVRHFLNLHPRIIPRGEYSDFYKENGKYLNAGVAFKKPPNTYPTISLHTYTDDPEAIGEIYPNITFTEQRLLEKLKVEMNISREFKTVLPESDEELGESALQWLQLSVDWKIPIPTVPTAKKR